MPGWLELAYTTAGGVIGAALTNHLSRTQERRRLRAEVMRQLHRVAAVREGVSGIEPRPSGRRAARYLAGERPLGTERLAVAARLEDGGDAEHALREAISDLVVAALAAGVPRRVLDFAGGAEERALQTEVIRLADAERGVLGDSLGDLVRRTERYRRATAQHLLRTLWRPYYGRLAMRLGLPALRREVNDLHHAQLMALDALDS